VQLQKAQIPLTPAEHTTTYIIPADKKLASACLEKIHLKLGKRGGQAEIGCH
jgi:hypothetical protein